MVNQWNMDWCRTIMGWPIRDTDILWSSTFGRLRHIVRSEDYKHLWMPLPARNLVLDRIALFKGRLVEQLGDDSLVGVFSTAVNAVRCAKDIQHELLERMKNIPYDKEWDTSFRMGLSTGQPLTEDAGFFSKALLLARRFTSAPRIMTCLFPP